MPPPPKSKSCHLSPKSKIAKKQKLPPVVTEPIFALRAMRHRYAADVAKHAAAIYKAAKSLQAIENAMAREATVIAGEGYEERYAITFDGHGSIENQLENLGVVEYGSGINDIVSKAVEMEAEAIIVANSVEPPKLPYESDDE